MNELIKKLSQAIDWLEMHKADPLAFQAVRRAMVDLYQYHQQHPEGKEEYAHAQIIH